jgi:hypothetical protein
MKLSSVSGRFLSQMFLEPLKAPVVVAHLRSKKDIDSIDRAAFLDRPVAVFRFRVLIHFWFVSLWGVHHFLELRLAATSWQSDATHFTIPTGAGAIICAGCHSSRTRRTLWWRPFPSGTSG